MRGNRLGTWLRWLRATATFVFIAALCLAVAVLVIALIPGSPVTQELPAAALTGLHRVGGVTAGVAVDPSGWIPFTIHDPSLAQRLLDLLTVLPGLVLVAEIARRMANLLRGAQASDPFTADTARALVAVGKLTAFAGLGAWILSQIAQGVLSCDDADLLGDVQASSNTARVARRGTDLRRLRADPGPGCDHAGRTRHRHLMTEPPEHRISVHLDELLQAKGMTLVELSSRVGVTVVNLSILKNGHARAIRFNTLTAICDALGCTPGELLSMQA